MRFFKAALSFAFLASSALAQFTEIISPVSGSTLISGSNITVQVGMADTLENVDDAVIIIGFEGCASSTSCVPSSVAMGQPLYQGLFNPVDNEPSVGFYENFTVTIPSGYTGAGSLNVLHVFLIGDAYVPVVDYLNNTVNVVS